MCCSRVASIAREQPREGTLALTLRSDGPLFGRLTEPSITRLHDGLGTIRNVQLGEHMRNMIPHCLLAEHQSCGDIGIVETLRDQMKHITLPLAELRKRITRRWRSYRAEIPDHPCGRSQD